MVSLQVTHRYAAAPPQVFAIYTDHAGWSDWAGFGRIRLVRTGTTHRNGVGAVRAVPGGGREEVVAFEPDSYMAYRVVKGLPLKHHFGEVHFTPVHGGTEVRWKVTLDSSIPGTNRVVIVLIGWVFRRVLRRLERRLECESAINSN